MCIRDRYVSDAAEDRSDAIAGARETTHRQCRTRLRPAAATTTEALVSIGRQSTVRATHNTTAYLNHFTDHRRRRNLRDLDRSKWIYLLAIDLQVIGLLHAVRVVNPLSADF